MEKLSDLKEKSEYEKVRDDYSNNYGYNIGFNSFGKIKQKDKIDNFVKGEKHKKKVGNIFFLCYNTEEGCEFYENINSKCW